MATRIAWLLNLDADLELEDPVGYRPSAAMETRIRGLLSQIDSLVSADDVLLTERSRPDPLQDFAVCAFSPTPSALLRIEALGFPRPVAPSLEVLRAVNDRGFCAALGQTLPNAAFVHTLAALTEQVAKPSPNQAFIIKRPFSFAGRDRRFARDGTLDTETRSFCEKAFARGEGLQVEPWLDRLGDFSRHGFLKPSGALLMGPVFEQSCDARGRFVGASVAAPGALSEAEDQALEAELVKTAEALHKAGYFGPFGIDAFRYRGETGPSFNPRCEINARFTMSYPRALLLRGLAAEV